MIAMKPENPAEKSIQFNFLDEKSKKEPYIIDVLTEIYHLQSACLPSCEQPLATLEHLKSSRSINIPYTTARNRNIEYLVDYLLRLYPTMFKTVTTFDFHYSEETKKLGVSETVEYTVMLSDDNYKIIQDSRDRHSLENLLSFIAKFRIINLSKILKNSTNKSELTRIIKMALGTTIFTFKNYRIDKNRIEYAEDFCFHARNYERVRDSLNYKKLKDLAELNSELVMRRLKKYGILNPDFSDYRDSKLEYIVHILHDDIGSGLPDSDLIEVKNFRSLRNCLLKVDTILDPSVTIGGDIAKAVRESGHITADELLATIHEATPELLEKWGTQENLLAARIIHLNHDGKSYYLDGARFFSTLTDLADTVVYKPEKLNLLAFQERNETERKMELFRSAAAELIEREEPALKILNGNEQTIAKIREIITDYEGRKSKQSVSADLDKTRSGVKKKVSIWNAILNFFRGLFGGPGMKSRSSEKSHGEQPRELSATTRSIYQKLAARKDPVIPLSDYIDVSPVNNAEIDRVINELRENNLKVVVPVYNAREALYPKKSRKLIIPDVEYLLVPPDVCRQPDEIRTFTDSLSGSTIKDEIMPVKGILLVEKYLLTVYRQKRAQQFKKEL